MKKNGNILITVIFMLFIISLMGIIVTKYVQNIMSYSNELNKYFNAYYKSYAGIELSLTKVKNHDFGFEEKIVKDSGTNEWNFKYCKSYECYFESTIKNRSKLLTDQPNSWDINNCSGDNAYNLPSGGGFLIPLYRDNNEGEGSLQGHDVSYMSQSNFMSISLNALDSYNKNFAIGVAITDSLSRNIVERKGNSSPEIFNFTADPKIGTMDFSQTKKSFLLISNTDKNNQNQIFCVNSPIDLPSKYVTIDSIGRYGDRYVSLQAVKTNALPDYLIYNIIN